MAGIRKSTMTGKTATTKIRPRNILLVAGGGLAVVAFAGLFKTSSTILPEASSDATSSLFDLKKTQLEPLIQEERDQDTKNKTQVGTKNKSQVEPIDIANRKKFIYHHYLKGKSGVVIHEMLLAHAWAFHHNVAYGGSCGEPSSKHKEHEALLASVGLEELLVFACPRDHHDKEDKVTSRSVIPRNHYVKPGSDLWTPDYVDYLKSHVDYPPKIPDKFTIAVHVRRHDVTPCQPLNHGFQRYLPNLHFQNLIDKYTQPNARVVIFSQSNSFEPFDDFINKGYEVKLDDAVTDVWQTISTADVVIVSRSSFSLIPSVVSKGKVV
jgi:hypothetical protein